MIITEKLSKFNLQAYGFQSYEQMEYADFRDFLKEKREALSRSLNTSEVERMEKLQESLKA